MTRKITARFRKNSEILMGVQMKMLELGVGGMLVQSDNEFHTVVGFLIGVAPSADIFHQVGKLEEVEVH